MALNLNNKKGETVIDPYSHKERFERIGLTIKGVSERNRTLIQQYLKDMQNGVNVGGSRGYRSFARLNASKYKITKIARLFEEFKSKNLDALSEEDVIDIFKRMDEGIITREDGLPYKSVNDYLKTFKAFWHWHQKVMHKKKKDIPDITVDLHVRREKPKFVYFTFDDLKKLCDHTTYDYKVIMWFMFDSGIRAPTELANIKGKDFVWLKSGTYQLEIREEISKTFGRKIKLLLCSDMIKKYIETKGIKHEDFLFKVSPRITNRYLSRLGHKILGIGKATKKKYRNNTFEKHVTNGLTMYDFRHCSACYWLPRYKSESALKYRFGWKKSEMIHYYTEFMGMKDTITEEDLVDADEKTLLHKELDQTKIKGQLMEERMKAMEKQLQMVQDMMIKDTASTVKETYPKEGICLADF